LWISYLFHLLLLKKLSDFFGIQRATTSVNRCVILPSTYFVCLNDYSEMCLLKNPHQKCGDWQLSCSACSTYCMGFRNLHLRILYRVPLKSKLVTYRYMYAFIVKQETVLHCGYSIEFLILLNKSPLFKVTDNLILIFFFNLCNQPNTS
jgi:hypothetical protein